MKRFIWYRWWAVVVKEFVQMRRDRLTFGMMVGIPMMQLILFGFAINSDPKNLPMAVVSAENSPFTRTLLKSLDNSGYLKVAKLLDSEADADRLLAVGDVQFVLHIPAQFEQQLIRGEHPVLLLEADATDPSAIGNALSALGTLSQNALDIDLQGALSHLKSRPPVVDIRVHRRYNPDAITQYNVVPGLMGVVLTMTMVMITALAITRERERGTMENLLATPARPLEVMTGKIIPYILIGYIQLTLILLAANFIFHVPMVGEIWLLYLVTLVFIAANLSMGITFSTIATNQLQAMQMAFFFFLPSILLSGFMFPFRGMPQWAQYVGEILPMTHFLRLIRGILLKGNGWTDSYPHLLPILAFLIVIIMIGVLRYRETLE
jgi:ABC-2 type transport system permease protein